MEILIRRLLWMLATGMASLGLTKAVGPRDFSFDKSGISNRLITPNGDGLNDAVVLSFSNPRDSQVVARIYDLKGGFVASMAPGPVASTTLKWDGRSNGQAVPAGVYVYVLEAEQKVYTGSVVVVR